MANPVWVLSVDLQTKTATFQSGMADAAKAARGSFNDIKSGAGDMGRDVSTNMTEARHGVMLLGEEFGIHLPRALTSFISSLGPIGAAMEAAFPFLAIIVGATLLIEHLEKVKEEGEKLTEAQMHFGAVTATVLNDLDQKLLQAGIRADELSGNHLAALEKQLQLIDRASLKDLEHSFEELAKASDATMAQLKTSWYQFGAGSDGAKHALDEFKSKYDLLLAQGKDKEASDLLKGTLESAEKIQRLQATANGKKDAGDFQEASYMKFEAARAQLKQQNIGIDEKAVQAQNTLVDLLNAQVTAEQKVHDLKKLEDSNAKGTTQKTLDTESDKADRIAAQELKRAQDEEDRLYEEHYKEVVAGIQQTEREKIAATEQGSKARLDAIDAAIKEENAKGLQETGFYRELLTQRVNEAKQFNAEMRRQDSEAKMEDAAFGLKMAELQIAAERESNAVLLATKRKGDQARVKSDEELENEEYAARMKASEKEIAALDKTGKDYDNKLKALQDRQTELVQAHENKLTQIKDKAEIDRNNRILSAERHLNDTIASNLTNTLMRHQSFGFMITSLGSEVASGMMQNAIKSVLADDFTKEHDAAAAARKAFLAGMQFPFPANVIMAPVLGAAAFASVMAFAGGGLVPGVGIGDVQPAMLEPGETVLPKKMTERLSRSTDSDNSAPRPVQVHVHHNPVIHALDAEGMGRVLQKNADVLTKHVEHTLRKMNH